MAGASKMHPQSEVNNRLSTTTWGHPVHECSREKCSIKEMCNVLWPIPKSVSSRKEQIHARSPPSIFQLGRAATRDLKLPLYSYLGTQLDIQDETRTDFCKEKFAGTTPASKFSASPRPPPPPFSNSQIQSKYWGKILSLAALFLTSMYMYLA